MKILALLLGVALAPLAPLSAQVSVEVVLDQEHFLSGEQLTPAVRITNRSGQTLHLGGDEDWLTFALESRDGRGIVAKHSEPSVLTPFTLETGKVATRRVDLLPHFDLARAGRYTIVASVRIKDWDQMLTTKPKSFDIINGAKLWSQDFGVPVESTPNRAPEVRKYTLEQANYLRTQLRLYFRLTDAGGERVLKVFSLGPMVSFGTPDQQIDQASNLHVLFQNGARAFSYTVINPDGDIIVRETHDYAGTRPRLQLGENGRLAVVGGVRRRTPEDVPEEAKPELPKLEQPVPLKAS
jgi:hypothetical protein